nr:RNA-directed DNA polymerase, eukaryota, reverse transcriptase zinc-binding domain protein [Tanacetum cinerariifolium]
SPSALDFGPIPFKFYNSWLIDKHLHDIVIDFWEQHNDTCINPIVRFGKKMKALKPLIKEWSNNRSSTQSRDKEELLKKIKELTIPMLEGLSAFIKNRQILDGPLMLLKVMRFMRFNNTWIKWISGCLFSATSSILINGSPTCEFNINRGLRQGDPLSPFLFIIAMEGLHVALEDDIASGLYRCCNAMQTPVSYLGRPIDCNMANVKNWDPIIDNISKRLSKWKSLMIFIGGMATLISSVLGSI